MVFLTKGSTEIASFWIQPQVAIREAAIVANSAWAFLFPPEVASRYCSNIPTMYSWLKISKVIEPQTLLLIYDPLYLFGPQRNVDFEADNDPWLANLL